jgi:hypothetical protein
MSTKYRISYDLSSPVKLMGLTKEELFLGFCGLSSFIAADNKIVGLSVGGFFVTLLWLWRRFSKHTYGLNPKLFLWWQLGIVGKHSIFPPSHTRRIG